MGIYVVGDVHGCYEQFMELVNKIDGQDPEAHYILVGDIIDRGPNAMKMLRWAMENCNKPDGKYEMLLGNHEYEKIFFLRNNLDEIARQYAKKGKTYRKNKHFKNLLMPDFYYFDRVLEKEHITWGEVEEIYNFIENLPVVKELDIEVKVPVQKESDEKSPEHNIDTIKQHFIIVHGGVRRYYLKGDGTFNEWYLTEEGMKNERLAGRLDAKQNLVWDRYITHSLKTTIVVVGHTPTCDSKDSNGRIAYTGKTINVDCGCVFRDYYTNANLAAIRLEDLEEFYVYEPTEITETNREARDNILKSKTQAEEEEEKKNVDQLMQEAMDKLFPDS